MELIKNLVANKLATKMSKLMFLAVFNAIGIVSVLGIPVVEFVDAIFILLAIKSVVCGTYFFLTSTYRKVSPIVIKIMKVILYLSSLIFIISLLGGIYQSIFK